MERLKIFSVYSGNTYERSVSHFVVGVKNGATPLAQDTAIPSVANRWYFDPVSKKLYVNLSSEPKTQDLSVTYRFFFSTAPIILPFDLSSGVSVEWDARLDTVGAVGQQLDEFSTGIVLESQSSIKLQNQDGYFDAIFDTLIWENQSVKFYSYIAGTLASERRILFDGLIESKDFGSDFVNLKVRDFVFRLQNRLSLELFNETDGDISPSIIGKPKRRIYGRVRQARIIGIDQTLDGYDLTGSISCAIDSDQLVGVGTEFLKELSPEDEIIVVINGNEEKFGVQSIQSDTLATLSSESDVAINSATDAIVGPKIPYRFKNRVWHVAGHKLRAKSSIITSVISPNRFEVDDSSDLSTDSQTDINGDLVTIRRISGNTIVMQNAVAPLPSPGDTIDRLPVNNAFFGNKELIYLRDWTLSNTTEAKITIDPLAEFNITQQRKVSSQLQFTNGSRTLTTSASVDLRSILKTRDWIRKDSVTQPTWYEILEVQPQEVTLRAPVTGTTQLVSVIIKTPEYIDDESLLTVNCLGMERDGEWVRRPAEVVRDLVLNDAGFSSVNETAFSQAIDDCDYTVSLIIPESVGQDSIPIKDVITKVNESVFGSLYGDSAFNISYSILNAEKPEIADVLKDDDILSWESNSSQSIVNKVIVSYSPFVDFFTGEDAFSKVEFDSGFVDRLIGIDKTLEKTIYLFEQDKAEIITQRLALFNSLSSTVINVKAKLNLATKSIGDKMFIALDRLYSRYGGRDRRKIGTITGIKKSGLDTDITFVDLSNVYNRVPAICPNTTQDYSAAVLDDIVRWGYIVDNDTETPDNSSELQIGNNLIG